MKPLTAVYIALALSAPFSAFGQLPATVSYQGRLDSAGAPVRAPKSLTFAIYDAASGGTELWKEAQPNVPVTNGMFSVQLGAVTPLPASLFTGTGPRWLGVTIAGEAEMTPRFQFTSAPFALRAGQADAVADNAVTAPKIPAAQVVKSLNGLRDNVVLTAAGGALLTKSGDTLTITAGSGSTGGPITAIQTGNNTLDVANPTGPTVTINVKDAGISTAQLADNAVTAPKIPAAQVVKSFNGLKDDVTLTAAGGATVSASGNTITITAGSGSSGGGSITGIQNSNNTLDIANPNGPTVTVNVKDAGITATQLAGNAVTGTKLADNAVSSSKIADGTIGTADLADNAVTAAKLAVGAITVADNSITSAKIADGAILTADLSDNAVTGAKIADRGIGTTKVVDGAITSPKIADGAVGTAALAAGAVTSAKIAAGAVSTPYIGDNAVTSAKIVDGTIVNADLADNVITSNKIVDGTVGAGDLANGAVTSGKIAAGVITNSEIAAGAAILASKISGDVGLEYAYLNDYSSVPTSIVSLGSVSVTCPASGYILAFVRGSAVFFGDNTCLFVGLSTSSTSLGTNYAYFGRLDGSGTLRFRNPFTHMEVLPVSAGSVTVYCTAQRPPTFSSHTVSIDGLLLACVFIGKRY